MSLTIMNDVSALTAESQLSNTQASLQKTLTQLSTGLRINSGADDAAGLSIVDGMQANIAALTQSTQNASNGVGLLQTADGALSQVTQALNRATTLATEASNSGLSTAQHSALNDEFQSILGTINSIGQNTNFNGSSVFGSNQNFFLSDGDTGNMMGAVNIGTLSASSLLGSGTSATNASNTLTLTANVTAGDTVNIGNTTYTFVSNGGSGDNVDVGGTAADTLTNLANAVNGNSSDTSVKASASNNVLTVTAATAGSAGNSLEASGTLTAAGGPTGTWSTTGNAGDLGGGADAGTAWTMVEVSGNPNNDDTLTLGNTTYEFVNTISGPTVGDTVQVKIGANAAATIGNMADAMSGGGTPGTNYSTGTTANSEVTIGSWVGAPGAGSFTLYAASSGAWGNGITLTRSSSELSIAAPFGGGSDAAAASATLTLTSNLAAGSTVDIGNTTYTFVNSGGSGDNVDLGDSAADTLTNLADAITGNSGDTSVRASASGNVLTLTASAPGWDGDSLAASGDLTSASGGSAGSWSSDGGTLTGGANASGGGALDLNNTADAQAALLAVTSGIDTVAAQRGSIGASINQLQSLTNVMTTEVQNLTGASNSVDDADIGATVANMTQYNVLESTGMAALQQANQAQQAILKLVQ